MGEVYSVCTFIVFCYISLDLSRKSITNIILLITIFLLLIVNKDSIKMHLH